MCPLFVRGVLNFGFLDSARQVSRFSSLNFLHVLCYAVVRSTSHCLAFQFPARPIVELLASEPVCFVQRDQAIPYIASSMHAA